MDRHGIDDARFSFIQADAAEVADTWEAIDFLHIDTDPHTREQTRRWFDLYAAKCRAIALHDTHHPAFGVGAAVCEFLSTGEWAVFEYWGNHSGWTVLTRPGEPFPGEARPERPADRSRGGEESTAFRNLANQALDRYRPDVLLTYGGHAASLELMAKARRKGIAVVLPPSGPTAARAAWCRGRSPPCSTASSSD